MENTCWTFQRSKLLRNSMVTKLSALSNGLKSWQVCFRGLSSINLYVNHSLAVILNLWISDGLHRWHFYQPTDFENCYSLWENRSLPSKTASFTLNRSTMYRLRRTLVSNREFWGTWTGRKGHLIGLGWSSCEAPPSLGTERHHSTECLCCTVADMMCYIYLLLVTVQ